MSKTRDERFRYDELSEAEPGPSGRGVAPGKVTLTSRISAPTATARDLAAMVVQALGGQISVGSAAESPQQIAARGVSEGGEPLPHLDQIQRSFGHHDLSEVRAHIGGAAAIATDALSAEAFAFGRDLAFGKAPDLHTTAHEAAHAIQQRAGVNLKGGLGETDDAYERHADAVADAVVAGQSAEHLLEQEAPTRSASTARSATASNVQRQIDPALLRERIRQMRTENLMVLYVDAHSGATHELYSPRSGIGTRRAWDTRFLRRPAIRRLLRSEFRGAIDYLIRERRWETLYWLHSEFPASHLAGAAASPLSDLQRYIQTAATAVRTDAGTGWDAVQNTPTQRSSRASSAAEHADQVEADVTAAVQILSDGLRRASGMALHRIVFLSSGMRTLGGHAEGLPSNWAGALNRYLRTLAELSQGRSPSVGGNIPNAPVTASSHMVTAAARTWRRELSESQRATLADDDNWARVLRDVWPVFQARLRWGIEEAGYDDVNAEGLDRGRWRNPGQALYH